jgi:hypothetical protein
MHDLGREDAPKSLGNVSHIDRDDRDITGKGLLHDVRRPLHFTCQDYAIGRIDKNEYLIRWYPTIQNDELNGPKGSFSVLHARQREGAAFVAWRVALAEENDVAVSLVSQVLPRLAFGHRSKHVEIHTHRQYDTDIFAPPQAALKAPAQANDGRRAEAAKLRNKVTAV